MSTHSFHPINLTRKLHWNHFPGKIGSQGHESISVGLVVELDDAASLAGATSLAATKLHLEKCIRK
jgi:hypothetical protein